MNKTSTPSEKRTDDQEKKLRRLLEDIAEFAANLVLSKVNPDKDGLQCLLEHGDELKTAVAEVAVAKAWELAMAKYDLARSILGDNFLTPQEVAKARGIVFTNKQLETLANTLPTAEELQSLRKDDYILVPGPADPKSLLDIRIMNPAHFYTKESGWYANDDQVFSRNDKATVRWFKVPKTVYLAGSLSKNLDEQTAMVPKDHYVLNAGELAWVVTTYHAVRGIYLLPSHYVRTISVNADGNRVYLGNFDSLGLDVRRYFGDSRAGNLGLAVARK